MEPSSLFLVTVPGIPRGANDSAAFGNVLFQNESEIPGDSDHEHALTHPNNYRLSIVQEGSEDDDSLRGSSAGSTPTSVAAARPNSQPATATTSTSPPSAESITQALNAATSPAAPTAPQETSTSLESRAAVTAPLASTQADVSPLTSAFIPPPGCLVSNGMPAPPTHLGASPISSPTTETSTSKEMSTVGAPSVQPPTEASDTSSDSGSIILDISPDHSEGVDGNAGANLAGNASARGSTAPEEIQQNAQLQQHQRQLGVAQQQQAQQQQQAPQDVAQQQQQPQAPQDVAQQQHQPQAPQDVAQQQHQPQAPQDVAQQQQQPQAPQDVAQQQQQQQQAQQQEQQQEQQQQQAPVVSFDEDTEINPVTGLRQRKLQSAGSNNNSSSSLRASLAKQKSKDRTPNPAQVVSDFIKASNITGASRVTIYNATTLPRGGAIDSVEGGEASVSQNSPKSLFIFRVHKQNADKFYARLCTLGIAQVGTILVSPLSMAAGIGAKTLGTKRGQEMDKDKFADTIKARIAVSELTDLVHTSAVFTFDYAALVFVASTLALLGLAVNSSVIIVASMLVSPLMGPIIAVTFGAIVADFDLSKIGLRSEVYGLFMCVVVGFLGGLIAAPLCVDVYEWPTEEMVSRGTWRGLVVGILIAIPSGVGVALSILGNNTSSLVGVAISASLLPPAVNSGMLLAYSALTEVIGTADDKTYTPPGDLAKMSAYSLALCLVNILIVWIAGIATFRLKEVARLPGDESTFFTKDVKVARHFNTVAKNSPEGQAMQKGIEQYLRLHGVGSSGEGGSLNAAGGRAPPLGEGLRRASASGVSALMGGDVRASIAHHSFFQEPQANELLNLDGNEELIR